MFEKRVGNFYISDRFVFENWRELLPVFSKVVILRCEHRVDRARFEYVGLSERFRVVPEGMMAPWYEAICKKGEDGETIVIWQELDYHG